jgi:pimeloyl-ACP methyl ester carboxylesterase
VKRLKLAAAALAALLLLAGAFFAAAVRLRPFRTVVTLRELALRRGGVARVKHGALAAWERDRCAPGAPCRCVALIHGMGDSALTWDKVMLGLGVPPPPEGTRVVALELPGTDGSDRPGEVEAYRVPRQAAAVRAALEPLCPAWTVAGNSLGGWISAELALQWPEGVEKLVLLNAAGLYDPSGLLYETGRILSEPTVQTLKDFVGRAKARPPENVPPRAWQEVVDSMRSRPIKETFAAFRMEDVLDKRAKGIRAPTAILWGDADRVVPADMAVRMSQLIPKSTLEHIPDCGHLPQQECPAPVTKALFGL